MRKTILVGIFLVMLSGQLTGCRPQPTPGFPSPTLTVSTPTPPLPGSPAMITASPILSSTKRPETPSSTPSPTTLITATPILIPTATPGTPLSEPDSTTPAIATPTLPPVPTETTTPISFPLGQPIQGMNLLNIGSTQELSLLTMAGGYWTRFDRFHWDAIEPLNQDPPNYHWDTVNETSLINATASGAGVIAIIQFAPFWAQKLPGVACGPFSADAFDEFARFMQALVSRYSQPPYLVKYWEIGNEPDISSTQVSGQSGFGCWGDPNAEYFGGGYYAEMLKAVYPRIKAADPDAQVLVGGLLLDCDPVNPPDTAAGTGTKKDCSSARFIEGILKNGGGDYFDAISFHAYDYYFGGLGKYGNKSWGSTWNTTGPVLSAKVDYLRGLLALYGHPEKYLMNTEVAILCGSSGNESTCQTEEFARTKANYLADANAAAQAKGIQANLWYSLSGWRASGLVNGNWDPLPAYQAYQASVIRLAKAVYTSDITAFPQVKGYEFIRDGTVLWVLWSIDGEHHVIQLPSQPNAIYDVLGQPLTPDQNLTITLDPLYIEWSH
jgi:hypothetical protein